MKSEKTAAQLLREMAFGRDDYKAGVRRHLIGGLNEFCKAAAGKKNGLLRWVDHWTYEADRLILIELPQALLHDTKFKNRRLAAQQEVEKVRAVEAGFRRRLTAIVARDNGLEIGRASCRERV